MIMILIIVLAGLLGGTLWYIATPKLRVAMYHHFGPAPQDATDKDFYISAQYFKQQLQYLKEHGYETVSLQELEDSYTKGTHLPKKPVALTFDDGWADNYTVAFPIIKEHGVKVNIFLSVAQIGVGEGMMDWDMVKEMYASGLVSFGPHGLNHKRLRSLSNEEAYAEMHESKVILDGHLATDTLSFCYPYGAVDKRIRTLFKKAGYKIDYGTRKGINYLPWRSKNPLKRIHVMAKDTMSDFKVQLLTGRKL